MGKALGRLLVDSGLRRFMLQVLVDAVAIALVLLLLWLIRPPVSSAERRLGVERSARAELPLRRPLPGPGLRAGRQPGQAGRGALHRRARRAHDGPVPHRGERRPLLGGGERPAGRMDRPVIAALVVGHPHRLRLQPGPDAAGGAARPRSARHRRRGTRALPVARHRPAPGRPSQPPGRQSPHRPDLPHHVAIRARHRPRRLAGERLARPGPTPHHRPARRPRRPDHAAEGARDAPGARPDLRQGRPDDRQPGRGAAARMARRARASCRARSRRSRTRRRRPSSRRSWARRRRRSSPASSGSRWRRPRPPRSTAPRWPTASARPSRSSAPTSSP